VPNALRGPHLTAGRQGRRPSFAQDTPTTSHDSSGGSTWLVALSLLARSPSQVGSAPTRRAARMRNRRSQRHTEHTPQSAAGARVKTSTAHDDDRVKTRGWLQDAH